jgi:2-polyprenyl-3-methyl-5-hydroxy-6-metoxy-1,4-benzoquinol methylase
MKISKLTKSAVAKAVRNNLIMRNLAHFVEVVLFGTELRERLARGVLSIYYGSVFRRQWAWQVYGEPHYSIHSVALFALFDGRIGQGLYTFARAFLSAEIIGKQANVLDIGCGDGALTRRFYAPRAAHVDAVDIEESAIRYAVRHNSAPNISYCRLDAVVEGFPRSNYDVIIFDGAIGHFTREGSEAVLKKISYALAPGGVFCGSESVGREGRDHLQIFETSDDLRALLRKQFKHVRVKQQEYPVQFLSGNRIEAFWRCSNTDRRLEELDWK